MERWSVGVYTGDLKQGDVEFARNGHGQRSLAAARGTMQEDTAWGGDAKVLVDFGVREGVLNELTDVLQNTLDATQVRVRQLRLGPGGGQRRRRRRRRRRQGVLGAPLLLLLAGNAQ